MSNSLYKSSRNVPTAQASADSAQARDDPWRFARGTEEGAGKTAILADSRYPGHPRPTRQPGLAESAQARDDHLHPTVCELTEDNQPLAGCCRQPSLPSL